jgi:Big-like domain-containing protein
MNRHHDEELNDLVRRMPALEPIINLLRMGRLKPPPLDPNFRPALRRRLMQAAYERYETQRRPSFLARLFGGPGMAVGLAAAAMLLLAFVLVVNGGSWFGPGQVQVTTVGAVSVNQPITVSFNQPMDHLSVEKAIQIEPATQVTYTWHGNNLVIQPSSGELAPNTQYHVTVAADAKTAPGVKIGQAAVVAVNTTPLPTPSPTPNPSPSPPAPPQITAERSVPTTSGRVVGWSADGHSLFFISASGDLDLISSDGAVLKTIASGVRLASVMPGSSTLAYATSGSSSKLYTSSGDASGIQVADTRSVDAIGWLAGKPVVQVQGEIGPAGTTAKLPVADVQCVFAPDGNRLICATIPSTSPASPKPIVAFLFDVIAQKATNWPAAGQGFAWRPDGSKVAYWSGGSVFVAAPDGSGPIEVGKSPQPSVQAWSPDGLLLLFANQSGASIVKADGSALHLLSQASFQDPVWAPSGGQFAFARGSSLWIDDLTVGGTAIDLGAAGRVVDQYEQARIKNDVVGASGMLAPSASPTTPSSVAGDARLTRYFVISSQATATEVRCTVRLIFAKGSNEVRYQDEQLVIIPVGADLKIGSITDSPAHDLGKGPTVNSVQLLNGFVVVVFDSDLDPGTVAGGTELTGADGKPVALTTSFFNRRLTVTAKLNRGEKYHLSLASSIKDIAGQSLQGGYDYDFVALAPAANP